MHCPSSLTVLYDPTCALCVRCREWLENEHALVPLVFLPCTSVEARERYGEVPWLGDELVVVSDADDVWAGPAAFLVCLWALHEWREWSYRLSGPAFAPLAERFFHAVSSNRRTIAAMIAPDGCPASASGSGEHGSCRVPTRHRARVAFR